MKIKATKTICTALLAVILSCLLTGLFDSVQTSLGNSDTAHTCCTTTQTSTASDRLPQDNTHNSTQCVLGQLNFISDTSTTSINTQTQLCLSQHVSIATIPLPSKCIDTIIYTTYQSHIPPHYRTHFPSNAPPIS
jgi:hypothetical protein